MQISYPITSKFLEQESFRKMPHSGIDFAMNLNEPLRAVESGIVKIVDFENTNVGKGVLIKMDNGQTLIYGHLNKFAEGLTDGQRVNVGDLIGYAGSTGHSTGVHLHFGLKDVNGNYLDPSHYIDKIQNMNDPIFLANAQKAVEFVPQQTENVFTFTNFFKGQETFNQELLKLFKTNFTTLISDIKQYSLSFISSIDYTIIIQNFHDFIQFFF